MKENKYSQREEEWADQVAEMRSFYFQETDFLQTLIEERLNTAASKKITRPMFFCLANRQQTKNVRTVYFNKPFKLFGDKIVCLVEMPADRQRKISKIWVALDQFNNELPLDDLNMDSLLVLADRLTDVDCSLNPLWVGKEYDE
jgi:hypothetical protein